MGEFQGWRKTGKGDIMLKFSFFSLLEFIPTVKSVSWLGFATPFIEIQFFSNVTGHFPIIQSFKNPIRFESLFSSPCTYFFLLHHG